MPSLALTYVLLALAAGPRAAPTAEEQRLYDVGARALQAGDPRAAEAAWQQAHALGHDPAFLVHIGEAQEAAGSGAAALESYRRYLREVPDAADRPEIERRMARLAPAGESGPPSPPAPEAAEPVGELGATAAASAAPPPAAPRAVSRERPISQRPTELSAWNRYSITAYATAGAALLMLGTAGFFAAEAASDADDLNRLLLFRDQTGKATTYSTVAARYEQTRDDGERHARYAKIALAGAVGAAAISTVFFVLDARHMPEPALTLEPGPGGLVATAGWSWRY
jgi:tetratricopeptide (TPR) repeat protein